MNKNNVLFKYILWIVIIASSLVLLLSSYKQIKRIQDIKNLEAIDKVEEVVGERESVTPFTGNIESKEEEQSTKAIYSTIPNPQKELIDQNSDYQGWIEVEASNVDFPVVKAQDNKFYLDRDFQKNENELGSIFMDYRNVGNFNDRNTVIYGHNMKNGDMFGGLRQYLNEDFAFENTAIIFTSLYEKKEFEIFSVYVDSADSYQLEFKFQNDLVYEEYLLKLEEMSRHSFGVELNPNKKLITLATCSYELDNGRLIIHGIEK